jgi:uncharacterized protein YyaL (SSP411 family)
MPNRLIHATSPYLLQHAYNPVDWWEWGPEALARAREEDKPIFLSIGYAACHWCHVMAHESFEDPDIARILNEHFIAIKVDREERPDVDAIYMDALTAMTGSGGWPMSIFLTPDGEPFYGGTYFPPTERYGIPSFRRVLQSIIRSWQEQRDQVQRSAAAMRQRLAASAELTAQPGELTTDILDGAFDSIVSLYDDYEGGFGSRPKFPQAMILEFLLRQHARTGDPAPLAMVEHTLRKMANGGIYDQLGGGFHRYSTDERWLAPHFEKMLYDNALLARVYLHTWQITGKSFYRRIVEETLDYILREMTHPAGGFFSAQDADSEGEEGKFFLWTPDEVVAVLGEAEAELFNRYYDVSEQGNFEGKNILHVNEDLDALAQRPDARPDYIDSLRDVLTHARQRLFLAREQRPKPARDEKILAAWNGLMMRAFAEAGAALDRPDYIAAARRNAQFILDEMTAEDGRLFRSWKDGRAQLNAYLEDYADVAEGLIALYQSAFEARWLFEAERLLAVIHRHFWDEEKGAAFHTADDHQQLIVRRKDFYDGSEPGGNSATASAALRLARLLDRPELAERAEIIFRFVRHLLPAQPMGFGHLLCALDFYLRPSREIVLIGDMTDEAMQALHREASHRFLPDAVLAGAAPGRVEALSSRIPLLADRVALEGRATAYVCRNFVCKLPVTTPEALAEQLSD